MSLPDPAAMLATADRIAAHASAARTRAGQLAAAVSAVDWRGVAADAFHGQAHLVIGGLRASADRLDDAADALRRHAHHVAAKIAELERLVSDLGRTGGHLLGGVGDLLTHPGRLWHDGLHIAVDATGLGNDVLEVVGLR